MPYSIEERKIYEKERATKWRALLNRWKRFKGCAECGYKEHAAALQLDHIVPLNNGKAQRPPGMGNSSIERRKRELAKCRVLCANCHAVITYGN